MENKSKHTKCNIHQDNNKINCHECITEREIKRFEFKTHKHFPEPDLDKMVDYENKRLN